MKTVLVLLMSLLGGQIALAQQGKVEIIGDTELEILLVKKVASVDTIALTGYRIQIYFGSNRSDAQEVSYRFKSMYPDLTSEVYDDYYQPSWRVRVGNFYRKIDAQKLMRKLEHEFGDVFLVRDIIELPAVQ